ncbi:MAG TPA: hypothetical protein VK985_05145 [Rariglobus sp.]|nr:hypothetical protein [Rariglobus sp.]
MRPAHCLAVGVILACALGLVAHRVAAPRPLASPAASATASISVHAPARPVESAAPLLSPDKSADNRLLLARRCLALAERDPLAAMEMALANHLQDVDSGLLTGLIGQWAMHDFDGAHAWIKTQEAGDWRNDLLARLAYMRAQTDPLAAARLAVADISAGPARDEAMISVLHQWALRDPEMAKAWAESFQDDRLKTRALAEIQGLQNLALNTRD